MSSSSSGQFQNALFMPFFPVKVSLCSARSPWNFHMARAVLELVLPLSIRWLGLEMCTPMLASDDVCLNKINKTNVHEYTGV